MTANTHSQNQSHNTLVDETDTNKLDYTSVHYVFICCFKKLKAKNSNNSKKDYTTTIKNLHIVSIKY